MDALMTVLLQIVLLAILAGYFALLMAAGYSLAWFAWHVLHDHWTLVQTWRETRVRLLGLAH
ncbi:MAG: hypothetical protein ABS52_08685 [Gemmatimonadetes bacterium SCN 70-22]|nr:MAG: hypothetical protein ABS52_08685 [Gemmatimonadetes bacterium SCN 70-22]